MKMKQKIMYYFEIMRRCTSRTDGPHSISSHHYKITFRIILCCNVYLYSPFVAAGQTQRCRSLRRTVGSMCVRLFAWWQAE